MLLQYMEFSELVQAMCQNRAPRYEVDFVSHPGKLSMTIKVAPSSFFRVKLPFLNALIP